MKVPRRRQGRFAQGPGCVDDVKFLRSLTDRQIKYTIPGPFTMSQQAEERDYLG